MKLLFISTGGTIASRETGEGFTPVENGESLIARLPEFSGIEVDVVDLYSKDSTNLSPSDWSAIVACIRSHPSYDCYVMTHGTDTMAYTSSLLSFVLRDLGKPVVMTGAMLPMSEPGTDAKKNLTDAFRFAETLAERKRSGVSVAFSGKLMHGPRVKKITGKKAEAFKSVYYDDIGASKEGAVSLIKEPFIDTVTLCGESGQGGLRFSDEIVPVKLFPGFRRYYFDKILDMRPKAIVIESFGLGGLPYMGEDLLSGVGRAVSLGILPVITTQCPEGGVDLDVYEVGRKALKMGAVGASDMSFEATITKLMWLMSLMAVEEVPSYLTMNLCDEVGRA